MRTLIIVFSVIALVSLSSCKQDTDLQELMKNADTRNEMITAIANNHEYLTEFMTKIHNNDYSMQKMMKDSMMMNNMMDNKQMMLAMMKGMMSDGKMMKMMCEKGMMSEECMESCKQMMNEKGMDMMDDMKGETKVNHLDHH